MKASEGFILFFAGMAFFSAIGILLSRRLVNAAFSLFFLLLSIAGIYGALQLQAALLTQLVLYIGGIMVLIGFALQLYPEPVQRPAWKEVRESIGKGIIMLVLMGLCLYFAPWKSILDWEIKQTVLQPDPKKLSLKTAGRQLLLDFPLEFEWLGILMLAGMMTAGWFLKEFYADEKP